MSGVERGEIKSVVSAADKVATQRQCWPEDTMDSGRPSDTGKQERVM